MQIWLGQGWLYIMNWLQLRLLIDINAFVIMHCSWYILTHCPYTRLKAIAGFEPNVFTDWGSEIELCTPSSKPLKGKCTHLFTSDTQIGNQLGIAFHSSILDAYPPPPPLPPPKKFNTNSDKINFCISNFCQILKTMYQLSSFWIGPLHFRAWMNNELGVDLFNKYGVKVNRKCWEHVWSCHMI